MGFFAAVIVSLIVAVVGELLRPKQKPPNARAAALDDFDIPTAEEGRSIPAFCGKVKIDGANCVWYGDLYVIAIKKKVKTGWFSSTKQTINNRYELGMQLALAHGFDRDDVYCHEILFGDKMPKHTRTDEPNGVTLFEFNDLDFFGGNEKEGGIQGKLRFYSGTDSQGGNAYFAAQIGEPSPPYQNLVYAMLERMYLGTSQYIKPVSFILSSYPNQLGMPDGMHIIGEDTNPACQIYELMTSKVWGVGTDPSDVDVAAFRAEGERWFNEGYGISMIYNGGATAKDLIAEILRHVDGVMFSDPKTGLITIRSARADYDIDSIPEYGPDDFQEGIQFSRPSWSETKNTIKANYIDRTKDFSDAVVSMQDLSNIMQRDGEIETETLDFRGFTTWDACALATARSLKTLSYPLAKMSGPLPRAAWATRPGDVFKLTWPRRSIYGVVFRVVRVDYGSIAQNLVGIEAVEDIFAISNVAYTQPDPSDWNDPVGDAMPALRQQVIESPLWFTGPEGVNILALASRASNIDFGYKALAGLVSGTLAEESTSDDFSASAVTVGAYPADTADIDATGFLVTGLLGSEEVDLAITADDDRAGGGLILLKSASTQEFVSYGSFNIGTGLVDDVKRGVLDTVADDHPAGTQVWFMSSGYHVVNGQPISSGLPKNYYVKLLPFNPKGAVEEDDATEMSVTLKGRFAAPLPPGKIRINGTRPDLASTITGAFTLTWAHRTRADFEVIAQSADSRVPEAGATYTIIFTRVDTNAVLVTKVGISNTASSAACDLNYAGDVRVQIFSVLDGVESFQRQDYVFTHAGGAASTITADEAVYILDGGGA